MARSRQCARASDGIQHDGPLGREARPSDGRRWVRFPALSHSHDLPMSEPRVSHRVLWRKSDGLFEHMTGRLESIALQPIDRRDGRKHQDRGRNDRHRESICSAARAPSRSSSSGSTCAAACSTMRSRKPSRSAGAVIKVSLPRRLRLRLAYPEAAMSREFGRQSGVLRHQARIRRWVP